MFKYLMAFLALAAVTLALPNPEARPEPAPNPALVYSAPYASYAYAGLPYAYAAPGVLARSPLAYTYY